MINPSTFPYFLLLCLFSPICQIVYLCEITPVISQRYFMARSKEFDENEILAKAIYLFWEKGYHATSAQDLVDRLGISRSSMYDTFGDKHSLFIKALQLYRKQRIEPVISGVEGAADIETYIRNVFEAVKTDVLNELSPEGCFMVNAAIELSSCDKEVADIAKEITQDTENALTKAIKKGQEQGIFNKNHSARIMARFVFNSLNGLRVSMKFNLNKKMFDDILNITMYALKA